MDTYSTLKLERFILGPKLNGHVSVRAQAQSIWVEIWKSSLNIFMIQALNMVMIFTRPVGGSTGNF